MNTIKNIVLTALLVGLFASCIEDQESPQEIFQKDLKKIEDYLAQTDYQYIKKEQDPSSGIVILWDSLSYSGIDAQGADTLKVHYVGRLLDETVFDTNVEAVARENGMYSSERNYAPLEVFSQEYIQGFLFALSKMEKGDRARAIIPSAWAYGNREYSGRIPANSVLMFDLDMKDVIINEEEITTEE
ncbi:FKBP-type peptidyl-prolyl cis-trans isomerase [Echinicola vietnamensis]|uniref:Peptidyl-prolyl cis-trans isomerase n=1 Tax=Echinicola vietnamensis (strain DSM 17526 / LMG 23754 / KMM 6221) TaxID=926556 RepID=L0FW44_ECHVK|nr:FKBP-type peptidyl-prolyl cis-trans isomerase [Echinicola vietnamensis]AGA77263.1 FKBP-type peptidyl-prolyl cis-trans isomerase [Echinicola vietnamensis DSM 17526]